MPMPAMCFLPFPVLVCGQSSSTITGQVKDQSGAAPKAAVIVAAVESKVEHMTTANENGCYTAPSLPPVHCTVSASAPGFKQAGSAIFNLDTTATARIDLDTRPCKRRVAPRKSPPNGPVSSSPGNHELRQERRLPDHYPSTRRDKGTALSKLAVKIFWLSAATKEER